MSRSTTEYYFIRSDILNPTSTRDSQLQFSRHLNISQHISINLLPTSTKVSTLVHFRMPEVSRTVSEDWLAPCPLSGNVE